MKGVILSGGNGTRLRPLTLITSKQLLPIYNKPMIYYPLEKLLQAGIRDFFIIVAPDRAGDYLRLLGSGKQFGAHFTYEIQDEALGLAHALSLAESFADGDDVTMILGDNIFTESLAEPIKNFRSGAMIFAKEVPDPERFGVVEFDANMNVLSIEEKPPHPKSNFAQVGLYIYDKHVFDNIRAIKPSARGELEITDLNNVYLRQKQLQVRLLQEEWIDAGTFESLFRASELMRQRHHNEQNKSAHTPL